MISQHKRHDKGKGKGKQRDLGQQRDREPCLQIIVNQQINSQLTKFSELSFQPHRNHDDGSPLDTNPDTLDDFNADKNAENMDDWLDGHIMSPSLLTPRDL